MVHTTASTLHLHYDVEKPGYRGYDRRHFCEHHPHSSVGEYTVKPRSRTYASSSANLDEDWRPHGRHIEPTYSNIGPDWQSRLRSISAPRHPDAKPTLPVAFIERNIHFIRPYPQNWQRTDKEWRYFTDAPIEQSSSKRNHFNQIHLRSLEDLGDENMFMSKIGRKKRVLDARNGLGKRSEGDKSYQSVEQSTDYHKIASPVPQVNFGRERKPYGDRRTIVAMKNERISIVNESDFLEKERQREYKTIVDEVVQLEKWKPAGRVSSAFKVFDPEANEKTGGKYRPRVR